ELPSWLVAVVDHIQLRESGWWETAQRECIVNGLFQRQPAIDEDRLLWQVIAQLGFDEDAIGGLKSSLSALVQEGRVIRPARGRVKLAESEIARITSELAAYQSRVESVERRFCDLVQELAPHLDGRQHSVCSRRTFCCLTSQSLAQPRGGLSLMATSCQRHN